jgi:hypothetical protein
MTKELLQERLESNLLQHDTIKNGILYKYCSFETLMLILKGSSLYYSSSDQFNDPFELSTEIVKEFGDKFFVENVLKISDSQILQNYNDKSYKFHEITKNVWSELRKNIGICCFSKSPIITLMWSHYANKHMGVCIGFNFDAFENTDKIIQMPVKYVDVVQKFDYWDRFEKGTDEIFVYNWLLTKSKVWEYEEEVRRIHIKRKGIILFNINAISEIYLGIKTTESEINLLESLLLELNLQQINIIKTKINYSTYSIGI